MSSFSPDQAKLLLQKNTLNLANRLKEGETLSAREVSMLESIADGGAGTDKRFAKNQIELAEALGIDRKTIQRWIKKPGHPETAADGRYDVTAWRVFAHSQGGKKNYGDEDEDADIAREKAKNLLLQNRRLEYQIKILRKEYVSSEEVEKWGAHLGGEIRKTVVSIHKVASSLSGLPPAEIEIRLRELEDEILSKLHLMSQRVEEMKEAANEE